MWFDFQLAMSPSKRYKQLKLGMDSFRDRYDNIILSFTINSKPVCGVLKGNSVDWMFQSDSPAFVELIPSGILKKYALWWDVIPKNLDKVYNGILEAAFKAGYDLVDQK